MKLDYIVTLANKSVKLRFVAMERSLRATGCKLPLLVIPYDDQRFDLPGNATWWEIPEIISWLKVKNAHPTMRKYQCLTISNYQFVDADVCFLRNPEDALSGFSGFVTSCCHWHNPDQTFTAESLAFFSKKTTTWQKTIFNTGQYACDQILFTSAALINQVEKPNFVGTCLNFPYHEQPGINYLVNASGISITNLTLPPWNMQSSWAGDYVGEYKHFWKTKEETPYIIHWAGLSMATARLIDQIFINWLTEEERMAWELQVGVKEAKRLIQHRSWRARVRRMRNAVRAFRAAFTS